jgi:hypothetical protein
MRKRYTLTHAQYERLLDCSRPVPYLVIGGHPPRGPQERANDAWCALGDELGFDGMSVRPEGTEMDFSAEVK